MVDEQLELFRHVKRPTRLKASGPVGLSPLGTARKAFLEKHGRMTLPDPLRRLEAKLRTLDLPQESLSIAREFLTASVEMSPIALAGAAVAGAAVAGTAVTGAVVTGAEMAEAEDTGMAETIALLVLAQLWVIREGNTRLPIAASMTTSTTTSTTASMSDRQERSPLRKVLDILLEDSEHAASMEKKIRSALECDHFGWIVGRDPGAYTPFIFDGLHLYTQKLWRLELSFTSHLAERLGKVSSYSEEKSEERQERQGRVRAVRAALEDVLARPASTPKGPLVLSDEQKEAVERAVMQSFTLISGGPGTGKTSIVVSVLRTLARLGVPTEAIAIAAPTGKAANRLTESINSGLRAIREPSREDRQLLTTSPSPSTLHRLLAYEPSSGSFRHHEDNPLHEEVVIVDEGSMIDLALMDQLQRAVRKDAKLILLGDAHQLPSVEAGAVFRDLEFADRERRRFLVKLEVSHRVDKSRAGGQRLSAVARAIHGGDESKLWEPDGIHRVKDETHLAFEGVELLQKASGMRERFLDLWDRKGPSRELSTRAHHKVYRWSRGQFSEDDKGEIETYLRAAESKKILCLTRSNSTPFSADAVNEAMHAISARRLHLPEGDRFLPGEPVIILRNDYERQLYNGDQGVVLRVRQQERDVAVHRHHKNTEHEDADLMAVFRTRNGLEAFHLEALQHNLARAHALTVHKAQGSEYDFVALFLPDEDLPLLTRELVYTALTRSRNSVVILGDQDLLIRAVRRRIDRFSGVGARLLAPSSSSL